MMRRLAVAVLLAALASACFSAGPPISGDSVNVSDVTMSFRVDPAVVEAGEGVGLAVNLRNNGGQPQTLGFRSAQRAEFWVTREDGREVWRFSDGRSFAQVLEDEVIPPQSGTSFTATWRPDSRGTYTAHARVLAAGYDRTLRGEVTVR